jgi:glycosyltransferase involved in cell wall biosynthesis
MVMDLSTFYADDLADEELGATLVSVLSSIEFPTLPISQQVAWILHCFQTAVTRYLKELAIIRSLVQLHSVQLYDNSELMLADACVLTESIMGLNWGDAASLFDMRGYDRYAIQPFSHYVRSLTTTPIGERRHISRDKKLKVAYFSHYAYTNSDKSLANPLGPFIRDILTSHAQKGETEVICYCVQWHDQEYVDVLEKQDILVRVIPQELTFTRLDELRLAILKDAPDIIISDVPSPIASWLFIHRVSPLQIYLDPGYPHWNLPELDWVLLPGKSYQRGFEIPSTRWSTIHVAISDKEFDVSGEAFPARVRTSKEKPVFFGAFARLIKFTGSWLSAVEEMLTRLPQASLLIVGSGNPTLVRRLVDNPNYAGRVSFINEMVDIKAYQDKVDVFLDTFPFIGGLVCREFMAHGVPVVSVLAGEWDELLRDQRDPLLLVQSTDDFVEIVERLVEDIEFYQLASKTSIRLAMKHNQPEVMIQDIEDGIRSAMNYVV